MVDTGWISGSVYGTKVQLNRMIDGKEKYSDIISLI